MSDTMSDATKMPVTRGDLRMLLLVLWLLLAAMAVLAMIGLASLADVHLDVRGGGGGSAQVND